MGCQPPQPSPDQPQPAPMHRSATSSNKRKALSAKWGPVCRRRGSDSDSRRGSDSDSDSDDEYHHDAPTSDSEGDEEGLDDDYSDAEDWMVTAPVAKAAPGKQTSASICGGGGGGGSDHVGAVAIKRKGATNKRTSALMQCVGRPPPPCSQHVSVWCSH